MNFHPVVDSTFVNMNRAYKFASLVSFYQQVFQNYEGSSDLALTHAENYLSLYESDVNLDAIVNLIQTTGVATVHNSVQHILNGSPLDTAQRNGYAVVDNSCSLTLENYAEGSIDALKTALVKLQDNTSSTETTVGFWLDKGTGTLYVDKVDIVPVLADAINLASSRNELAIWDNDLSREIRIVC
jgi:hypothetical protein